MNTELDAGRDVVEDRVRAALAELAAYAEQPHDLRLSTGQNDLVEDDEVRGETIGDSASGDAATGDSATGDSAIGDSAIGDVANGDSAIGDVAIVDGAVTFRAGRDGVSRDESAVGADGAARAGIDVTIDRAVRHEPAGGGEREDASAERAIADDATGDRAIADDATGDSATGDDATGDSATGDDATSDSATGDDATSDSATGDDATSDSATGDDATSDSATGDDATGDDATSHSANSDDATNGSGSGVAATSHRACSDDATNDSVTADDATTGSAISDDATNGSASSDDGTNHSAISDDAINRSATGDAAALNAAALDSGTSSTPTPTSQGAGEYRRHAGQSMITGQGVDGVNCTDAAEGVERSDVVDAAALVVHADVVDGVDDVGSAVDLDDRDRWRRLFAVAAAVLLLFGGAVGIALRQRARSGSQVATAPDAPPTVVTAAVDPSVPGPAGTLPPPTTGGPTADGSLPKSSPAPDTTPGANLDPPTSNGPDFETNWNADDPPGPPLTETISPGSSGTSVLALQKRLSESGFFVGPLNGIYGDQTIDAVRAFQALFSTPLSDITDEVSPELWSMIWARPKITGQRWQQATQRHIEIYLPRQVLVVYDEAEPLLITRISTGALDAAGNQQPYCKYIIRNVDRNGARLDEPVAGEVCGEAKTPPGVFEIHRMEKGYYQGAYGAMWDPVYFNHGIAIHGVSFVPVIPASFGSVWVDRSAMQAIQSMVAVGDEVAVFDGEREPDRVPEADSLPNFDRFTPDQSSGPTEPPSASD